jgi:hypothetical protein
MKTMPNLTRSIAPQAVWDYMSRHGYRFTQVDTRMYLFLETLKTQLIVTSQEILG